AGGPTGRRGAAASGPWSAIRASGFREGSWIAAVRDGSAPALAGRTAADRELTDPDPAGPESASLVLAGSAPPGPADVPVKGLYGAGITTGPGSAPRRPPPRA